MYYHRGDIDIEKDKKIKQIYHSEQAAIAGHPDARYNLGCIEGGNDGKMDRAVKHWIIAAKLGCVRSVDKLKLCYRKGSQSTKKILLQLFVDIMLLLMLPKVLRGRKQKPKQISQ